ALVARFGSRRLELACPVTSAALVAVFGSSATAPETRLRWPFVVPASLAGSTTAGMLTASVARTTFQSFTTRSFTAEAGSIIVDWADEVLPNHGWPVLVPLSTGPIVLSEEELE